MGLYLDQASLAPEHQGQDKQNSTGTKWSEVLKQPHLDAVANLELRSVRGHGLFHDDIGIYREEAVLRLRLQTLGLIFDFLVQNKIAPIIELASMPSAWRPTRRRPCSIGR